MMKDSNSKRMDLEIWFKKRKRVYGLEIGWKDRRSNSLAWTACCPQDGCTEALINLTVFKRKTKIIYAQFDTLHLSFSLMFLFLFFLKSLGLNSHPLIETYSFICERTYFNFQTIAIRVGGGLRAETSGFIDLCLESFVLQFQRKLV